MQNGHYIYDLTIPKYRPLPLLLLAVFIFKNIQTVNMYALQQVNTLLLLIESLQSVHFLSYSQWTSLYFILFFLNTIHQANYAGVFFQYLN